MENRKHVQELYLNEKELEGELDLADFRHLKRIYISHYVNESKLEIKNAYYKYCNSERKFVKEKSEIIKLVYVSQVQGYLDKNYPKEERKDIKELDLRNLDLVGDLDLKDFIYSYEYGSKVYITGNPRLGKIKNKRERTTIFLDAQVWLNGKYPNKQKTKEVKRWGREEISGELIITNFPQLEEIDLNIYHNLTQLQINNCLKLIELNCSCNNLTELTITNCPKLQKIWAFGNQLTNLDIGANLALTILCLETNNLTHLDLGNNQQLEKLDISNNNFSCDLSFISHLVNLKKVGLENNHFIGSLKSLQNLNKLEELDVSNTNIGEGLEYLPKSIEKFKCSTSSTEKKWAIKKIQTLLKDYKNSYDDYDYQGWRKTNKEFFIQNQLLTIAGIISSVVSRNNTNTKLEKVCQILVFYLEEEVMKCRKELYKEKEQQTQIEISPKS